MLNERKLTKTELDNREDIIMNMKKNKRALVKKYGKDAEAVMYGRATNIAKNKTENMNNDKVREMIKDSLKNPKAADLNKDGKLSDYEETRGAAIEKSMTTEGEDLKVVNISRVTGGMNPVFRVAFSDGFEMRSSEEDEFIDSKYYKLMDRAIDTYEYGTPIGATSHEDLYTYENKNQEKPLDESSSTEEKRIAKMAIKKLAKYRNVSEEEARQDLLRAANELGDLKESDPSTPLMKDFTYDYEDIGQFYLEGFNRPHSLTQEELGILGKRVVDQLYKGDIGAAYDDIVYKKALDENTPLKENKQEAADELQMIMEQLYELSDQAKMIFRNNFPGEYRRLDAYGALDFGTSSNRYDVTLEGALENLDMEDDDEGMMQEDLDLGHQDNEPGMLKGDLYKIGKYSMELYKMMDNLENMGGEVDFPHWWQSKIITAKNMISGAKHYLDFELKEPAIDAVVDATIDVVDEEAIDEIPQNEGIFDRFRKRSIKGTVDKEPYYFDIADKALLYLQKQDKEWRKYKLASVGPGDKKTHIMMALSHKTNHKTAEPEFKVYHDKNDNIEKVVELSIAETIDENAIGINDRRLDDKQKSALDRAVRGDSAYSFGNDPYADDQLRYKYAVKMGFLEETIEENLDLEAKVDALQRLKRGEIDTLPSDEDAKASLIKRVLDKLSKDKMDHDKETLDREGSLGEASDESSSTEEKPASLSQSSSLIGRMGDKSVKEEEPGKTDLLASAIQKAINKHKGDDAKTYQLQQARKAMNKGDLSKAEKIAKRLAEKLKSK